MRSRRSARRGWRAPPTFLIALLTYAVGWFVLTRTAFGKRVYAVGANRMVATLSGIRADRVKIQCR